MSNIELLIGQSSTEGERKRRARLELQVNKALPEGAGNRGGQTSGSIADICPPEIEIERELEIEKEIERELETGQPAPAAYGKYHNVFLTKQEHDELKADFPAEYRNYIERLSQYIASSGKRYQIHAATIRYWITTDRAKAGKQKGGGMPDYSFKEGESL